VRFRFNSGEFSGFVWRSLNKEGTLIHSQRRNLLVVLEDGGCPGSVSGWPRFAPEHQLVESAAVAT
jgi:hypothetical protein